MYKNYKTNFTNDASSNRNITFNQNEIYTDPNFTAPEELSLGNIQRPVIKKQTLNAYKFPDSNEKDFNYEQTQKNEEPIYSNYNSVSQLSKPLRLLENTDLKYNPYNIDLTEMKPENSLENTDCKRDYLTNDTFFMKNYDYNLTLQKFSSHQNTIKKNKSIKHRSNFEFENTSSFIEGNLTRVGGVTSRFPIRWDLMAKKDNRTLPRFMSKKSFTELNTKLDSKQFFKFNTNHTVDNTEKVFRDTFCQKKEIQGMKMLECNLFNCKT